MSWWVTPDAYARGHYTKLYHALRTWITTAFPFTNAYYSNALLQRRDTNQLAKRGTPSDDL